MNRKTLLALVAAMMLTTVAGAQIPDEFTNLQVLPKEIEKRQLIGAMRSFSMGLGVRCEYCHVGDPEQGFGSFDFPSDEKAAKKSARTMLQMTMAINDTHLEGLEFGARTGVRVRCVTCHRGQSRPVMLQNVLTEEVANTGADQAVAKYRELREEYYGSHTFDFSESVVLEAAQTVGGGGNMEAAMALANLNLEYFPESAMTHYLLGEIHMRGGDNEAAIASFEKSLALDPRNPRAQQNLEKLKAPPEMEKPEER